MPRGSESGVSFVVTATNATSAVATKSGVAGVTTYVTAMSGSSDKAGGLLLLKDGTTVIWQDRISNTAGYFMEFPLPIQITKGGDVSVTVDGTAIANANLTGFTI